MYYVKVEGKTLADLKRGLERHLDEINGFEGDRVSVNTHMKANKEAAKQLQEFVEQEEEMEEVVSPFAKAAPALTTIVDNELDSEGLPWDERIHASSKAKVGGGTWRSKRGVSDEDAAPIKAELKARVSGAQVQTQAPVSPVIPFTYAKPVEAPVAAPVPQPIVEAPVVAPVVVAQPVPAIPSFQTTSGHTLETFKNNFAMVLASLITEGKLTQDYVNSLKTHFKVPEIWMADDNAKASCFEFFVQNGLIQKVG